MDNANQSGSGVPPEPRDDRLTSWKEIASYLDQGVTTVQRWEQDRGLPIYRQPGKKRGPVYAYKSELDDWWREKGSLTDWDSQKERPGFPVRARWLWLVLALGVAASFTILMLRDGGMGAMPSRQTIATLRFRDAAVSPDGRWLAYTDVMKLHLRVRDLSNGSDRELVDAKTAWLAWAHDSRKLAYVRGELPRQSLEIVDTRSGEISVVLESDASGYPFLNPGDWSLDDKWLLGAWRGADHQTSIGFLRVQDGFFSPRVHRPVSAIVNNHLRLSPDGRFAAYSAIRNNNIDIYVAPLEGDGEEIRLTSDPRADRAPVWSPDGRYVLFIRVSDTSNDRSLWAVEFMRSSGVGEPVRIGDLVGRPTGMRESFDAAGNLLVGSYEQSVRCQLIEVDPATGLPVGRRISDFPESSQCGDWSADSNSFSYRSNLFHLENPQTVPSQVRVVRDLTTQIERIESSVNVLEDLPPRFSFAPSVAPRNVPDYRWRFYTELGQPFIFRYDTKTGEKEPFWESGGHLSGLSIAPNADYLAFGRRTQARQKYGAWLMRLEDKEVRKVGATWFIPHVTWSPDGTELAFTDANCLMVMRPEDPQPTRLACATASDFPNTSFVLDWPPLLSIMWERPEPSWGPDGKKLAWSVPVVENERVELWIVDRATGEHEVAVAGEPDYYTMPFVTSWSPNGKWLAINLEPFPDRTIQALSDVLPTGPASVAASGSAQ